MQALGVTTGIYEVGLETSPENAQDSLDHWSLLICLRHGRDLFSPYGQEPMPVSGNEFFRWSNLAVEVRNHSSSMGWVGAPP